MPSYSFCIIEDSSNEWIHALSQFCLSVKYYFTCTTFVLSHLRPFAAIFPLMFQKYILSAKFFHSVEKV